MPYALKLRRKSLRLGAEASLLSGTRGRTITSEREPDHRVIAGLLAYISGWEDVQEAFAKYCSRQARRLIEWHWPEIQSVAQAVLERTPLTKDDVAEVILSIPVEVLEKHRLQLDCDSEQRKAG
jgi:hypothetical protein